MTLGLAGANRALDVSSSPENTFLAQSPNVNFVTLAKTNRSNRGETYKRSLSLLRQRRDRFSWLLRQAMMARQAPLLISKGRAEKSSH
jgi:hypothetical protein